MQPPVEGAPTYAAGRAYSWMLRLVLVGAGTVSTRQNPEGTAVSHRWPKPRLAGLVPGSIGPLVVPSVVPVNQIPPCGSVAWSRYSVLLAASATSAGANRLESMVARSTTSRKQVCHVRARFGGMTCECIGPSLCVRLGLAHTG